MSAVVGCVASLAVAVCLTTRASPRCPPGERVALVMPLDERVGETCWRPAGPGVVLVRLTAGAPERIELREFER